MSDEKSKGISLRRKKTTRPTISGPRPIATREESQDTGWDARSTTSANTNLTVPGEGGRGRTEKTAELVKRRYSTRFAGGIPQSDSSIPPIPAVPNLPSQYTNAGRSQSRGDERSKSRDGRSPSPNAGRLKVDNRSLQDPNLQADKYVQSILGDATEIDIRAYVNDLQNVKDHASTDLQHNVYQNRTQFIKISKEADKLKSEMRTLRTLMSELTGALGQATSAGTPTDANSLSDSSSLSVADRKRANRSSVANLEAMWSTHLQTLWKRVEGSQKYLPALPGRHIILESQRWVELNAATWKPRRRVALVLLNDHLLVASEKKRKDLAVQNDTKSKRQSTVFNSPGGASGQPSQTTYVAERCWALQDVSIADISTSTSLGSSSSTAAIANALNIRAGNESFTYATSDNGEKAGLLVAFRKAQEDLRKLMAAEHGEREKQMDELSLLTGVRDPRILKKAAAASDSSSSSSDATALTRSGTISLDIDGRQQSIRSVESQIDTLDIDIALQRFEEAVGRVEKLRKLARSIRSNPAASEIVLAKVNDRAGRLASVVARQMVGGNGGGMEKTKEGVSWLLRLGFEEMARSRYLDSRTETIRLRTRSLPFTGALPPYLHALAYTTFTLILYTLKTFAASFPAASGSAVVKWAKERVEEFNLVLIRQMGGLDRGSKLWEECLQVVEERAKVLETVGVDFSGLVGKGLRGGEWEDSVVVKSGEGRGAVNGDGVGLGVSAA